jgi:ABC-type sugar transport system ATPase subunit
VVPQGAARNLLPYASLNRNIWLAQPRAAHTRGIKLDDPDRILHLVGLPGHGRQKLADLTPGGRQRAALAVGIAAGPDLLLVDEPTSRLDTAGRDEVLAALPRATPPGGSRADRERISASEDASPIGRACLSKHRICHRRDRPGLRPTSPFFPP